MRIKTASLRRLHRRLGLFVGLQVLMWTASGIYFAWTDLDEIHGDHLRETTPSVAFGRDWISPSAIDFGTAGPPAHLEELAVVLVGEETFYRIRAKDGRVMLADVRTGRLRPELSEEEAAALARQSFAPDASIVQAQYLRPEDVGSHHEYRGGPLPAWLFHFDHGSATHVYVATTEGIVTKHRNRQWRVFDFLWMLHTMDYRGRDDFNNLLLRIVSVLALSLAVSGYFLWTRTRRAQRRARAGP